LHGFTDDEIGQSYRRLLRNANAIICCSAYVRTRFIAASRWDPDAVHIVHNGTRTDLLQPATFEERARSRARLGIDDDAVVGLYAGAINPEKGVIHLIRAFNSVASQIPGARLLVAGGASLWGGMRQVSNSYENVVSREVSPAIQLLGVVPHTFMTALYHAADFAIVPSVWPEPFGMVALDAAAAGLPVIASRTGGLPEIVLDGQTGILIEPENEQVLGESIIRIAHDPELRHRLGSAGRQRSLRFSWDRATDNMLRVYEAALENKRVRSHAAQGQPQ
jgi:glycosyltransferase involved in cell wall biosynthesis